jgi:hypothetical protein
MIHREQVRQREAERAEAAALRTREAV